MQEGIKSKNIVGVVLGRLPIQLFVIFQDLHKALSIELGSEFKEILNGLLMIPSDYDAHCLHKALSNSTASDPIITAILCMRGNKVRLN